MKADDRNTLEQLWKTGERELEEAGCEEAKLDAWYLLEFVTHISRALYFCDKKKQVSFEEERCYLELIEKRKRHIPLQHLTKEREFMGLSFVVNQHVLIPRQDTEILVEEALSRLENGMEVLDMCTGSGCILVSLAHFRDLKKAVGVDISKEALVVAEENVRRNRVEAVLLESDLFEKVEEKFDMIVSNPPYIERKEIERLKPEVKEYEPRIALDGGEDGLDFYRILVDKSREYLKENGYLCLEIGYNQGEQVLKLLKEYGFFEIELIKDLAKLDRVCIGRWREMREVLD
ncbi:MAG: peptide chain release factor N(5)-glutamine methyltransferase [Lachnospiraceae bacterium]|jgi:release factor glutamine methyltransferase|nr:peptide chain release factor N(5)-glutamine methyltransferase [Lachnospiraceae bacterium]